MSDKVITDGLTVHAGRSVRTLKMHFTEPITFGGFLVFFNERAVRALSRTVLSYASDILQCKSVFSIVLVRGSPWCCGQSVGRARTVHAQVNFPKKTSPVRSNLRYSGQST
jgi:hypothetical protein